MHLYQTTDRGHANNITSPLFEWYSIYFVMTEFKKSSFWRTLICIIWKLKRIWDPKRHLSSKIFHPNTILPLGNASGIVWQGFNTSWREVDMYPWWWGHVGVTMAAGGMQEFGSLVTETNWLQCSHLPPNPLLSTLIKLFTFVSHICLHL